MHDPRPSEYPTSDGTEPARVWDVVVVGAGPSGSSAAAAARRKGATTLLVDGAAFPRYKTCGGGLIGISASLIPNFGELQVQDTIRCISFTLNGRLERVRYSPEPVMKMITRENLDMHLVTDAVRAGAHFCPKTKVLSVNEIPNGLIELRTQTGLIRARAVVGADGSSGRLARFVGVNYAATDIGLEYELVAADQAEKWRGRVHLDWGQIPGSYGWVFPKGDTLTVGVICERGNPGEAKDYLTAFVKRLGLDRLKVLRDSGHLTRCRSDDSALSKGRVLLAGDAAGLLEPWTREGISFAMRSGRLAGSHAAELARANSVTQVSSVTAAYAADIDQHLGDEMRAGALSRNAFSNHPAIFHFLIGWTSHGWRYFGRISSGDTTLGRAVKHRLARLPLRILQSRGHRGQIDLSAGRI